MLKQLLHEPNCGYKTSTYFHKPIKPVELKSEYHKMAKFIPFKEERDKLGNLTAKSEMNILTEKSNLKTTTTVEKSHVRFAESPQAEKPRSFHIKNAKQQKAFFSENIYQVDDLKKRQTIRIEVIEHLNQNDGEHFKRNLPYIEAYSSYKNQCLLKNHRCPERRRKVAEGEVKNRFKTEISESPPVGYYIDPNLQKVKRSSPQIGFSKTTRNFEWQKLKHHESEYDFKEDVKRSKEQLESKQKNEKLVNLKELLKLRQKIFQKGEKKKFELTLTDFNENSMKQFKTQLGELRKNAKNIKTQINNISQTYLLMLNGKS